MELGESHQLATLSALPRTQLPIHSVGITDLPYDLACKIFDLLDLGTATCFGLINAQFYAYLKIYQPGPLSLNLVVCDSLCHDPKQLYHHVNCHTILAQRLRGSELLRGYTLRQIPIRGSSRSHLWLILNSEIYTDDTRYCCGQESCDHQMREVLLLGRYKDWHKSFDVWHADWNYEPYGGRRAEIVPTLPSPFNLGQDWYDEAWKTVRGDADTLGQYEVRGRFSRYWRKFDFVKRDVGRLDKIIDNYLWEMWLEGLAGLGL